MKKVAVFGMGYVGCVTGACLARDGHTVIGVDVDQQKVESINAGTAPVSEPDLDDLIAQQVRENRLSATTEVDSAVRQTELAMIAVGTPSSPDGSVNCHAVEAVVRELGTVLSQTDQAYTIVIRSTLLPQILPQRLVPILEETLGDDFGDRVQICNNPEFLRETTAIKDYDDPPFVIVGAGEPEHAEPVLALYEKVEAERIVTDTNTAAMLKYACNAFHALKVAFANEIGALARAMDSNGQEVMKILCRDTRLNISPAYLRPGFAFGGSCLPKDVRALRRFAQQQAIRTDLLSGILTSNEAHIERAVQKVRELGLQKVGLVGLSFKAGTDDLRESPQVILAETLLGRGYDLKIFDPGVRLASLVGKNLAYVDVHLPHLARLLTDDPAELLGHSELLVLGTDVANQLDLDAGFTGTVLDLRKDLVTADEELENV